jgi:di/tricarboxylate transporter
MCLVHSCLAFPPKDEALSGFSNQAMVQVGTLFVIAQGVEKSRLIERLALRVFGNKTTKFVAMWRMMLLVFVCSAVFNNTPIVYILIPITR